MSEHPAPGWAVRIYAAALAVCLPALRRQHGDELLTTFGDRAAAAASDGRMSLASLVARELADLVRLRATNRSICATAPSQPRRRPVRSLTQDIVYACRLLRRQPAFSAVAIATLALGIGATTAVFTVVNGVLLRPLPYVDPDRILLLLNGRNGRLSTAFSPPNHRDVTTRSGVFSEAAAFDGTSVNLTGQGEPQRLQSADVTGRFFRVLGATAAVGRLLQDSDVDSGGLTIVLSDRFWRRQFGGRPDVVGSVLRIDGRPFEVVGVAPPDLTFPGDPDFWRPLMLSPKALSDGQRGAQYVGSLARLKPGVTLAQANAAIATVAEQLAREFPNTNEGRNMVAVPLHERIVRTIRPALLMLLGAVVLVLLIACVNVANLLLARANARAREVAVRAAVGAGRSRLVRQFLVESLVLGVAGALGGLAVAWAATRALVTLGPASIPRLADVVVDFRVLLFAIAVACGTSLLFGLIPALSTTGATFAHGAVTGRGSLGSGSHRLRRLLVVCEMALAVVLLVGAGLLIRSYQRLSGVNPGFSADHVLTFHLALPETKYPTAAATHDLMATYVERLGELPSVEAAAAVFGLPLDSDFGASTSFKRPGDVDSANEPSAGMRVVTPGYFSTLKIPLRSGRLFDARDNAGGAEVVMINEEAARRYWPDTNPIGQRINVGVRLVSGVRSGDKTIVGVVGDVKYGGLDLAAPPEVYLPYAQQPVDNLTIAIRTKGDPTSIVPVARAELASLDRELPIADVKPMEALVGRSIAERRFTMLLLAAFAAVALTLAAIGVYGVLAYVVSQRTQEIGLRMAIGATAGDVVQLFVREGVVLAVVGLLAGLVGAVAASRVLASMLFDVGSSDPLTFLSVTCVLVAAALVASYLPARRAAHVDPMEALRTE
ncbi:MAG TPA: ABC transporter permease [Vicinamibacterales bacterium]|jgi:putative ABC transport system permease protein